MRMVPGVVLRTQPDHKLALLAASGSEAAFEAMVQRHRRALLNYCRRLLLSESRSEDAVQQAFFSAWAALRTGTEVREPRAWLFRITHNQAMRVRSVPEYDFDELSESLHGSDAPQSDLERRMLMRETLAAVAALPEQQRQAILRTAVDGRSYEQVADALGISDDAVRGLVYRARASLRAGMAVLAPAPLVVWAADNARRTGSVTQWVADVLTGGGGAGGAVVAIKGATVLATSAVVVSGTIGGALTHVRAAATHQTTTASASTTSASHHHHHHRTKTAASTTTAAPAAAAVVTTPRAAAAAVTRAPAATAVAVAPKAVTPKKAAAAAAKPAHAAAPTHHATVKAKTASAPSDPPEDSTAARPKADHGDRRAPEHSAGSAPSPTAAAPAPAAASAAPAAAVTPHQAPAPVQTQPAAASAPATQTSAATTPSAPVTTAPSTASTAAAAPSERPPASATDAAQQPAAATTTPAEGAASPVPAG